MGSRKLPRRKALEHLNLQRSAILYRCEIQFTIYTVSRLPINSCWPSDTTNTVCSSISYLHSPYLTQAAVTQGGDWGYFVSSFCLPCSPSHSSNSSDHLQNGGNIWSKTYQSMAHKLSPGRATFTFVESHSLRPANYRNNEPRCSKAY